MSETAAKPQAEIRIDRLVLDIPGFNPAQAQHLAMGIADALARAGLSGEHAMIGVMLDKIDPSETDLAARIAASLMEKIAA